MALLFIFGPSMFLMEELVTARLSPELPPDFLDQAARYQKLAYIYIALIWIAIFAVKFSFLLFFKNLVRCIRSMTIYWWITTVGTGIVWAFGIAQPFISCPYIDLRSGTYGSSLLGQCALAERLHSTMFCGTRSTQSPWDVSYNHSIGHRNRHPESVSHLHLPRPSTLPAPPRSIPILSKV